MPVITEEKLRKLEKDGVLDQLVIEEKIFSHRQQENF